MSHSATKEKEKEKEASPLQRLVKAALRGDLAAIPPHIEFSFDLDLNGLGMVSLRIRSTELILKQDAPLRVRTLWNDLKTQVTALFAAAHSGHDKIVIRLLGAGVDVNRKLFKRYATTAAVREGHINVLQMLLECGASQEACEDALIEASSLGETEIVWLLISSGVVGPTALAHAIVIASSRGFVDVITTLLEDVKIVQTFALRDLDRR